MASSVDRLVLQANWWGSREGDRQSLMYFNIICCEDYRSVVIEPVYTSLFGDENDSGGFQTVGRVHKGKLEYIIIKLL